MSRYHNYDVLLWKRQSLVLVFFSFFFFGDVEGLKRFNDQCKANERLRQLLVSKETICHMVEKITEINLNF